MEAYEQRFALPAIPAADFQIRYEETDWRTNIFQVDARTQYGIYVNLSGNVSFLEGDDLYTLSRGDVILMLPGQIHHCLCHNGCKHRFYWIRIRYDSETGVPEATFQNLCGSLISPSKEDKEKLIRLCHQLATETISDTGRIKRVFRLLHLLERGIAEEVTPFRNLPEDLARMISYVEAHLKDRILVADMAKELYISKSTVNRHFRHYLGMSAQAFIRKEKLRRAAELLAGGATVLQAGLNVGYEDTSHFIKLFRQQYGVTPLQYKKSQKSRNSLPD